MDEQRRSVSVAIGLMQMALTQLERASETQGASRLQHAIDIVVANWSLRPDEEVTPEAACLLAGIPLSDPEPCHG